MSAYVDDAPADGRIVDLARQTTSCLEVLWDEVGYTPEEKRRQMQGLIDGFQTLCENKVCTSLGLRVGRWLLLLLYLSSLEYVTELDRTQRDKAEADTGWKCLWARIVVYGTCLR